MPNSNTSDSKFKSVGRDTILSGLKNSASTALLTGGAGAVATALGIKRGLGSRVFKDLSSAEKKILVTNALAKQGLVGAATGSIYGNVAVPAMKLNKVHQKEFGTSPDMEDYAKVITPRAIPNAAFWALAYKKRGAMTRALEDSVNAVSKFKGTRKLGDLKPALSGAGVGGSMVLADKATDVMGFINTPETVVRKKKEKLNGGARKMDIKTALEVVDEAFEKTALINEEAEMEKEAGSLIDVLSGKNVKNVSKQLERLDKVKGVTSVGTGVADAVGDLARGAKGEASNGLTEFMKSKGVKVDRNGQKINTTYRGKNVGQLAGEERVLKSTLQNSGSDVGKSSKEIKSTIDKIKAQKKQEASKKGGKIPAAIDNVLNSRTYSGNKKYNSKIDEVVKQMQDGKQVNVEDLTKKKGLFREKKVNLGYEQQLHDFNRNLQSKQKAEKTLGRAKNNLDDVRSEMNYQTNYGDIEKRQSRINAMDNVGKFTTKLNDTIAAGSKAMSPIGDVSRDALQNKLKEESARTMKARIGAGAVGVGAVGTGVAAGTFNKKDDNSASTKLAMDIINSVLMEK